MDNFGGNTLERIFVVSVADQCWGGTQHWSAIKTIKMSLSVSCSINFMLGDHNS